MNSSLSPHGFTNHLQEGKMKLLVWLSVLLCLFACHLCDVPVLCGRAFEPESSQKECHMMKPQLFPTGPTPPRTSGTTLNTSDPSAPTTTSTRWPGPSSPTSTSETPWDMRPTRDMNTEREPGRRRDVKISLGNEKK
ncbi:hypothetical protein FQN60_013518 [Etheostoma spectabile]|uniref:Uncharacterized protein n=1 Tax=Etheostoma spectabile TaxID=54343 RepID=A0A5J5CJW4_9PERO|nr:hypothetical protein FQN60_013518 [Etheostoma spectabile]